MRGGAAKPWQQNKNSQSGYVKINKSIYFYVIPPGLPCLAMFDQIKEIWKPCLPQHGLTLVNRDCQTAEARSL